MKKRRPPSSSVARKAVLGSPALGKGGPHGKSRKAQRRLQRAKPPSPED